MYRGSPTLLTTSSTPTPTGSAGSGGHPHNGLYAKVNKKPFIANAIRASNNGGLPLPGGGMMPPVNGKRESPDEGIQDDVSTDV